MSNIATFTNFKTLKDKHVYTIGAYWQAGIGTGKVKSEKVFFGYTCLCFKNENVFTIYQIDEYLFEKITTKYSEYIEDVKTPREGKHAPSEVNVIA